MSLRDSHADPIRESLSERSSRYFDSRSHDIFRMTGSFRSELSEVFYLLQTQTISGEMEKTVNQHRAMTGRKKKPVSVEPFRILWIMPKKLSPKDIGGRCHSQWQTRMSRIGPLNRIKGQGSDGVDTKLVDILFRHLGIEGAIKTLLAIKLYKLSK
jgi:hypothetical protein